MMAGGLCRGRLHLLMICILGSLVLFYAYQAAYNMTVFADRTRLSEVFGFRESGRDPFNTSSRSFQEKIKYEATSRSHTHVKELGAVSDVIRIDSSYREIFETHSTKSETSSDAKNTFENKTVRMEIPTASTSLSTHCKTYTMGCFSRKAPKQIKASLHQINNHTMCRDYCWKKNRSVFSIIEDNCYCAVDTRELANISSWVPCHHCVDRCESIRIFKTLQCESAEETNSLSLYIGCILQFPLDNQPPKAKKYEAGTTAICLRRCESLGKALAMKATQNEECWCGEPQLLFSNASRLQDELLKCSKGKNPRKLLIYWTHAEETFCSKRQFLNNQNSSITALMSLPGSGNTWLRYMLEVASGIYTGSFYNSGKLIREGFLGETLDAKLGRTLLVKDHFLPKQKFLSYDNMVLLIRKPYDSTLAEFQRSKVGKTGVIDDIPLKDFLDFAKRTSPIRKREIIDALRHNRGSSILIKYEDLLQDFLPQIKKILTFLGYNRNKTLLEQRLVCLVLDHEGSFKRIQNRKRKMTPFNRKIRDIMNDMTKNISDTITQYGMDALPNSYFSP